MPVHQHSDPFEDRVAAELRAVGGQFATDPAALTSAGLARGRRLRLRRRAAVVGGAASLALVGVGGTLLLAGGGGTDPEQRSVASDRSAKPSAKPSASSTAPAVTDKELIRTLKDLLGYGKFSEEAGRGTADEFGAYAKLVWDDGDGDTAVTVNLGKVQPGGNEARELAKCPDKLFIPYDSCKAGRLGDGSTFLVVQGYEYPDKREPTKRWWAELVTPTGQHVQVSEWNSTEEKGAPVTRSEPALDYAELKKLATAPAWLEAVDALPGQPPAEPSPTQSAPAVTDVAKKLVDLLPDGVQLVSRSEDEGDYGYVVVDDGKGKSMIEINVQPDMGDITSESFFKDGAETLPDGTMVSVREDGGDKGVGGAVRYTVDTVRADGLRVVISALNAGGPHDAVTRATPALTKDQLREIALNPAWG
ncbi:hypothetical protein [Streptomyces sp. NPDC046909]|uniref:hypothetical protein n=1 Tax=Streptomyces sp. NPDC046909 TaxID=3155617 RepID=UPI0033C8DE4D